MTSQSRLSRKNMLPAVSAVCVQEERMLVAGKRVQVEHGCMIWQNFSLDAAVFKRER